MKNKYEEILCITQEECAEVIHAISKILRFGELSTHPDKKNENNRQHLEMEIGDLIAMIGILTERGYISENNIKAHAQNKKEKLLRWSNIGVKS